MTVTIILAAGSSSRMGKPKMLLPYKGKTLMQCIIDEVSLVKDNTILVVTGCYHHFLEPLLKEQNIAFIKNEEWQNGMGSSVSTGINYILQHFPSTENVFILTCDQPFINATLLQQMIAEKSAGGKGIAACTYAGTTGVPVLFDKKYFDRLLLLKGNEGAKKIVAELTEDVCTIDFPEGITDIDEPGDYEKLVTDNKR